MIRKEAQSIIPLIYDSIEGVSVDEATGELVIQTEWGEIRDAKPVAYQEIEGVRKAVDISFRPIDEKRVGFAIGDYDPKKMLTLDPGYSTFIGGSNDDYGFGIAVDSSGYAYVTGITGSNNFPTTTGAYDETNSGDLDVFVTKLNSSGSALSYSTYIGGSSYEWGSGIAVDSSGNAYVTGYAGDAFPGFPTTTGAYDETHNGSADVFVTSLNSEGQPTLVELSLLTATATADGVTLHWRTEIEVDNAGFAVYRNDTKDSNYTKIGFVPGAENTEMTNDYQFTDTNVQPGKTYFYYLEDIDLSGEKSSSEIITVSVPPVQSPIPKEFRLLQNFPNPFNPDTWLPYQLPTSAPVVISIYNIKGQLVRRLNLGKQAAGSYIAKDKAAYWNGKDAHGEKVASGIYWYVLQAESFSAMRRMVILK